MLRSFMSGIAGLKSYQTKMDVIGNNVANVNTVGFKSSNVNFSDVFYQTTQSATSASTLNQKAGTNAKQIGYGSSVASINTNVATQGGSQTTNRALDLMINGNAFFIVGMDGQNYFTKNGAFDIDGAGYLSSESGGLVMGWSVDKETGNIVQDTVSPIHIWSAENMYAEPEATEATYFQGNIDSNDPDLENGKVLQMDFYDNLGNMYAAKFKIISEDAEDDNLYRVVLTDVIDSNENSIFTDAVTSNGQTTYSLKKNVTIDFGGYTYEATAVDKVTGAVTLISKNIKGEETKGTITKAAEIQYDGDSTADPKKVLYRRDGEGFTPILTSEINDYLKVDNFGKLSLADKAEKLDDCPYVFDGTDYTPLNEGGKKIASMYKLDDLKNEYADNPNNIVGTFYSFTGGKFVEYKNINDVFDIGTDVTTGKDVIKNIKATGDIYYLTSDGMLKLDTNNTGSVTSYGDKIQNQTIGNGTDTIVTGIQRRPEVVQMNQGANILFNASTGKFASVTGDPTQRRYDENGNPITTNVTFKVHTSDSTIETSAKNLFEEITIDFSSLTMFGDGGKSTVTSVKGEIGTAGNGAGFASGTLTGVSVSNDGKIYGKYDNGVQKVLGQIAVTTFANPTGLEAVGNSLFQTTVNSGDFDGVGSDVMAIGLSITSGSLESSNVDLSTEFTNMITTQRGFEANSKTITTSDSMLETLINLKR